MKILAIESSCDDSSIALIDSTLGIEFHWIYSHTEPKKFGGVVPELASRAHQCAFKLFLEKIMSESINLKCIDAIAYTAGPGLSGSLYVGASIAQGFAISLKVPIFEINHLHGHIFSPFIGSSISSITFPFITLLVSGGHTQLWYVESIKALKLLGTTRDDAAGEALDKVARFSGLGYPGGSIISECAKEYEQSSFIFPTVNLGSDNFDFSFSGLKSAFFRKASSLSPEEFLEKKNEVLAGFEIAVVKNLTKQFERAIRQMSVKHISMSGGVSANMRLRNKLSDLGRRYNCAVSTPALKYTGDNAAMIAYVALLRYESGDPGIDVSKHSLKIYTRVS